MGGKSAMKILKQELFRWVCQKHATDGELDRHLLREKAFELKNTFGLTDFKCSSGWVTNFLKEHRIVADPTDLPRLDPVFGDCRRWIDAMRSTIVKYKHSDLFHVDELSMYSDVLPLRISPSGDLEDGPNGDGTSRHLITVLMGCNSSGTTKLPLLVCGPYSSRTTTKDHVYCHSEDGSIGDDLFRDWLTALNDRMSRDDRKILLFLRRGRERALGDFAFSNVSLVYLPKDFPPMLRPLRRDVFHYVKMIFRRRYAERLRRRTSEWNLRDILESLIEAWETLPREIVIHSFQRTRFRTDDNFLRLECDCWSSLDTGISFKRFVTFDDYLSDEPSSSSNSDRGHGYNLRTRSGETIRIDELDAATEDSMPEVEVQRIAGETASVVFLRKFDEIGTLATRKTPRDGQQDRASGDSEPSERKEAKEPKFSESRESGERRGASGDTPRNVRNAFAARDCNAGLGGSIGSEAFERKATPVLHGQLAKSTDVADSVQAIVDEALTRTTVATAEYAKKLIAGIYASNREARSSPDDDPSAGKDAANVDPTMSTIAQTESHFPNRARVVEKIARASMKRPAEEAAPRRTTETDVEKNSKKRRVSSDANGAEDDSDGRASVKKKRQTDSDWFKEYETTFVFGTQTSADCSSSQDPGDDIAVSRIADVTPSPSPRN